MLPRCYSAPHIFDPFAMLTTTVLSQGTRCFPYLSAPCQSNASREGSLFQSTGDKTRSSTRLCPVGPQLIVLNGPGCPISLPNTIGRRSGRSSSPRRQLNWDTCRYSRGASGFWKSGTQGPRVQNDGNCSIAHNALPIYNGKTLDRYC
jgi:hypothetical protein